MRMLKVLALAAVASFSALSASAQSADWDGIRVGYAKASFGGMSDMKGWTVGYSSLIRMSKSFPVCLGTGIDAEWVKNSDAKIDFVDVSVPLNVGIKLNVCKDIAFFPYAGGKLRGFVVGTQKVADEKVDFFESRDMAGQPFERWHAGWNVGMDVQLMCFTVGVNYGEDFTKLSPKTNDRWKTTQIRVGLNF